MIMTLITSSHVVTRNYAMAIDYFYSTYSAIKVNPGGNKTREIKQACICKNQAFLQDETT